MSVKGMLFLLSGIASQGYLFKFKSIQSESATMALIRPTAWMDVQWWEKGRFTLGFVLLLLWYMADLLYGRGVVVRFDICVEQRRDW